MRKRLLFIIILCSYLVQSQNIEDVAVGFARITCLDFNNNDIYISDSNNATIYKFDVVQQTPSLNDILNWVYNFIRPIYNPADIKIKNQNMYFTTLSYPHSKISKVDLSSSSIEINDLVSNINISSDLAIEENYLYFDDNLNGIGKIDVENPNSGISYILSDEDLGGRRVLDLAFHENKLYIATEDYGISKINVSDSSHILTDVITGYNAYAMDFFNNELYFSTGSEIKKLETMNGSTTAETILLAEPTVGYISAIKFKGNELYYADQKIINSNYYDVIRKLDMSTLSTENVDHISLPNIILSPNPSSKEIVIHNLKEENDFKIFNILGKLILKGKISNGKKINIEKFNQGIYFLKIGNTYSLKFIKN